MVETIHFLEKENTELKAQLSMLNGLLPSEVYVTYDKNDGEVFCAFIDKAQCEFEAKDSGCGMQVVRLIGK